MDYRLRDTYLAVKGCTQEVDNELSRMVLDGSLDPGDRLVVGAENGRLTFEVFEGAAAVGASEDRQVVDRT